MLDHLDELLELAHVDFGPVYERLRGQAEHEPGELLPGDTVLHRGTASYHRAKRAALRAGD